MQDPLKELQEEEAGEEALEVDLEEAFPEAVVVSAEVEVSGESVESDHDRHNTSESLLCSKSNLK